MENLVLETWQAVLIGLVIGFIIGYLALRLTKGSVKKQLKTESELKQTKTELETQKQHLEKHFSESADLLKTLAQDYQKLYKHLATSSTELLPELANKELFSKNLIDNKEEKQDAIDIEVNKTEDDKDQPRDYSEGASGILKAEK
ncbi:hypothetical protein EV697_101525 [Bisgaardia hudsonensis]|uniref:Z-ring associated protein G n=1 Tax=Bisgaardia hudsonensis TaxID=109472 RepID=A0A4R2N372_9PAST|nr:DUF1043 family protein [Bisgaardia hudsonensis]QLB12826.1 hypothetical protein A6A11_03995 [Bisgaardia hudsonensis]TCP14384.1 hypothetical protein EV697_101525 [Bisgaardia hudsonensis]